MPEQAQHGSNGIGVAESRAHSRADVHSIAYVELGDGNAGILLNISETGLAVQTISVLGSDQFPQIAFRLPRTDARIEVSGKVVWEVRSKKQAGIQLVEVTDTARSAIRSWIAAEQARRVETHHGQPEVEPAGAEEVGVGSLPHRGVIDPRLIAPRPPVSPKRVEVVLAAAAPVAAAVSKAGPSAPPRARPEPLRSAPDTGNPPPAPRPSGTVPQFGYVPLAGAVDLRRPRRWLTYMATIGVLAAIAFAALMIFDPAAITRARNAALIRLQEANVSMQTADQTQQPATAAQQSSTNAAGAPAANSATDGTAAGAQGTLPTVLPGEGDTPPASASSGNAPAPNSTPTSSGSAVASDGASGPAPNNSVSETAGGGGSNSTAKPAAPARSSPEGEHKRVPADTQQSARPAKPDTSPHQLTAREGNARTTDQRQAPYAPAESGSRPSSRANLPASRAAEGSGGGAVPSVGNGSTYRSETRPPVQADQDAYAARRNSPSSPPANIPIVGQEPKSIDLPSSYSSPVLPSEPISGVPSGSVAANSQFRGIRIPPELESESSQLAGQLRIGQLLSSYAPAYPAQAARAGVEGTVRLSVIVGKDGAVKSVQVLGGPAMLTPVATAAVRDWRYAETFLAGYPIETTQYVTIVFRLSKPAE